MKIPLYIHEFFHISVSLLIGFIFYHLYKYTEVSIFIPLIIAFAGGVLIDLDHLHDYFIAYRFDFKLHKFLKGKAIRKNKHLYVLFHGYEYSFGLVIFGLFVQNPLLQMILFTLGVASLFHLIIDATVNNVYIRTYSILYRLYYSFNSKHIIKGGI